MQLARTSTPAKPVRPAHRSHYVQLELASVDNHDRTLEVGVLRLTPSEAGYLAGELLRSAQSIDENVRIGGPA